jgi:hypothetical protein
MTDNYGVYTILGLPTGSVYVKASSYFEGYISEWYDDAINCEDADSVPVVAGNDTPNIDFQLEMGGAISGHVYESDGITPIADALVFTLYAPCGGPMMSDLQVINIALTDASGAYAINGLPTEDIYVMVRPPIIFDPNSFTPPDYINEWYNNAYSCDEADPVVVTAGADISGIDFQLEDYIDSDGDGIADQWEIYYFGDITTSDGTADSDGDGKPDSMEWLDRTSPKDPYVVPTPDDGSPSGGTSETSSSGDGGGGGGGCFIATAAY